MYFVHSIQQRPLSFAVFVLCINMTYTALTTQKYAHPNALFARAK